MEHHCSLALHSLRVAEVQASSVIMNQYNPELSQYLDEPHDVLSVFDVLLDEDLKGRAHHEVEKYWLGGVFWRIFCMRGFRCSGCCISVPGSAASRGASGCHWALRSKRTSGLGSSDGQPASAAGRYASTAFTVSNRLFSMCERILHDVLEFRDPAFISFIKAWARLPTLARMSRLASQRLSRGARRHRKSAPILAGHSPGTTSRPQYSRIYMDHALHHTAPMLFSTLGTFTWKLRMLSGA